MPRLPGLNYGTPLTIDDLEHLETVYTDEFRGRTLDVSGSYRAAGARFGILSETDPVNATVSTEPLYVEQNASDPMRINVYPGAAVTESGMRVELTATASSVEMARTTIGLQNVCFIEYVVVEDETTVTMTRYNTNESRRTRLADETNADPLIRTVLNVVSMTDWQNDATFTPERRRDITVLALCTVVAADNTAGKEVSVDLSRSGFTVNRPWYSPVDIEHRSHVGTGAETTPHRLGLNDLSQGGLSLYDQLVGGGGGMTVAQDRDAPGVPGSLCFETITSARFKTDTTGLVTGTLSQTYVELTRYPVRLLGCYSLPDTTDEKLVELMPHSNLLLLHQTETIPTGGMRVLYSTVDAAEPLISSLINDEIHVRQPNTAYELLVAGGRGITEIQPKFIDSFGNSRAKISLATAPAIPKQYRILIDGDGQLLTAPQHLLCATRLDDIGTGVFTFQIAMLGLARIRVGLQDVDLNPATVVSLRITGTDSTGNSITEDVTFTNSTYESPVIGTCQENQNNFQVSNTVFSSATSIQVLTRTADGPNTAVSVFADVDPMQTDVIRNACPVAQVMWDGGRICRIQDVRRISASVGASSRTTPVKLAAQSILATFAAVNSISTLELLGEDLRDPHRFRLDDPLRFWKLHDGLKSDSLPLQPLDESLGLGLHQDVYVTHALRLLAATGRYVQVTLFGRDAQRYLLNGQDGTDPSVEYRWSATPGTWSSWAVVSPVPMANGANFRFAVDDTAFKIQLRVKGSIVGVSAIQYSQVGGSQVYSGSRTYEAAISTGETHKVAIPFGQTFSTGNYAINLNVYTATDVLSAGEPGVEVVHVERFVDHAVAHLTRVESASLQTYRIDWTVNLTRHEALDDGGFGDTIV